MTKLLFLLLPLTEVVSLNCNVQFSLNKLINLSLFTDAVYAFMYISVPRAWFRGSCMVVEASETTVKCRCHEQGLFAVLTSSVGYMRRKDRHGLGSEWAWV